ncbi:hypothetical protein NP233_g6119 [Leucocoprinus birnbaumii]|uniref:Uncharacterized protein n=1 Tax=Leucocoprinus birnbaumii TaxID=56174 RepID=A0AAD5VRL8_9AGAR|nr:hypothetical protein NP233_g6119 [Leucocoprinus birnbaumii]
MPGCEGRNNVFSAMITQWPQAPKRVVYDFSCALGPYCLLREPDFFADTLFIIDNFHARDHTKCANACFASTYAKLDPELSEINTSAAECGNSLILRIRKSVSYMSERHAIIYTKVFLSMINRKKIIQRLTATPWSSNVMWKVVGDGSMAYILNRAGPEWGFNEFEAQFVGVLESFSPIVCFPDGRELPQDVYGHVGRVRFQTPGYTNRLLSIWERTITKIRRIEAVRCLPDEGEPRYSLVISRRLAEDGLIEAIVPESFYNRSLEQAEALKPQRRDLVQVKITISRGIRGTGLITLGWPVRSVDDNRALKQTGFAYPSTLGIQLLATESLRWGQPSRNMWGFGFGRPSPGRPRMASSYQLTSGFSLIWGRIPIQALGIYRPPLLDDLPMVGCGQLSAQNDPIWKA